jgi:hypothetical protein
MRGAEGILYDLVRPAQRRIWMPEPDATAAIVAPHVFAEKFDAGAVQRVDHFHQTVDNTSHIALAGFHSLDRWQGDACHFRQGLLVDVEKGAGGTKLGGSDHRGINV